MDDRRKDRRLELESRILLKRLDENSGQGSEVTIDVTDVSKRGVGFHCDEALTIGAVYEAYLTIWTKEVLHAFLEIVRIEKVGGSFQYGAIFIGMPEMDSARIATYDTMDQMKS